MTALGPASRFMCGKPLDAVTAVGGRGSSWFPAHYGRRTRHRNRFLYITTERALGGGQLSHTVSRMSDFSFRRTIRPRYDDDITSLSMKANIVTPAAVRKFARFLHWMLEQSREMIHDEE
jgi:hypothetical protein